MPEIGVCGVIEGLVTIESRWGRQYPLLVTNALQHKCGTQRNNKLLCDANSREYINYNSD